MVLGGQDGDVKDAITLTKNSTGLTLSALEVRSSHVQVLLQEWKSCTACWLVGAALTCEVLTLWLLQGTTMCEYRVVVTDGTVLGVKAIPGAGRRKEMLRAGP